MSSKPYPVNRLLFRLWRALLRLIFGIWFVLIVASLFLIFFGEFIGLKQGRKMV